jgi:hypothetical protein
MALVGIQVGGVVEQVRPGRDEREGDERERRVDEHVALVEGTCRRRNGEHQEVLRPLLGPARVHERTQARPGAEPRCGAR